MNTGAPLIFKVPQIWACTQKSRQGLPINQEPVLAFADPHLTSWGNNEENYILQQVYKGAGITIVLLSIYVTQNSIIKVLCEKGIAVMQYTLQGYLFGKLNGYGCLPMFEDTYTLQYVPEGEHQVLFTPGTYHFILLLSD